MERLDLIIITVYLFAIVVVGLLLQKRASKDIDSYSWETENYLGGFLVLLGWLPILTLLVQ